MNEKQLTEELRQRQIKAGYVSKEQIDAINDEEIIKSYIICSECREYIIPYQEAIDIAKRSKNFYQWWNKIIEVAHHGC